MIPIRRAQAEALRDWLTEALRTEAEGTHRPEPDAKPYGWAWEWPDRQVKFVHGEVSPGKEWIPLYRGAVKSTAAHAEQDQCSNYPDCSICGPGEIVSVSPLKPLGPCFFCGCVFAEHAHNAKDHVWRRGPWVERYDVDLADEYTRELHLPFYEDQWRRRAQQHGTGLPK